jgi:hypothetical protein
MKSGKVELHYLDISQDKVSEVKASSKSSTQELESLQAFLTELTRQNDEAPLDYESVLRCYCESQNVSESAIRLISMALEEARK